MSKLFNKFKNRFQKIFAKELQRIDPGQFVDEEFLELYNYICVDPPEESNGHTPSAASTSRCQSLVQRSCLMKYL